jgi:hypothetical protein
MIKAFIILLFIVLISAPVSGAELRSWTDQSGEHTVEAELVDYDAKSAVLKKDNGRLVTVPINMLSKQDQSYLESEEAKAIHEGDEEAYRVWNLKDGREIMAQVHDFSRKQITVVRKNGKVLVGGEPFEDLMNWQQYVVFEMASRAAKTPLVSNAELEQWLAKQPNARARLQADGVTLKLEDGSFFTAPFFLFSQADQQYLLPGYEDWREAQENKNRSDDAGKYASELSLYLRSRARLDEQERAMNMMANKLWIQTAFGIPQWQVHLMPKRNMNATLKQVIVSGNSSRIAMAKAASRHPGYRVVGVRRLFKE